MSHPAADAPAVALARLAAANLAIAFALAAPEAAAQSFQYPDFSAPQQLDLLGDAATNNGALRLTANTSNQSGWAWRTTPVSIEFGFVTEFTFRMQPSSAGTRGEGLAFVIQNDVQGPMATGGTAWGLGYGQGASGSNGIRSALVLELDTFQDLFLGDSSDNELSLHVAGPADFELEQFALARTTPAVNLADGAVHTIRIEYLPGQIDVYVDSASAPTLTAAYDVTTGGLYANGITAPSMAIGGMATVGLCATTGAGTLTQLNEVLSWSWSSTSPTHPCYVGSIGEDVLLVENSTGGPFRRLFLGTSQAIDIDIRSPQSFGPGAPYVLLASLTTLAPPPGSLGTQLGFGESCFPMLPPGPTELIVADSFGFFGGVLAASPAPHQLRVPPGVLRFPITLTMQAVIATASGPLELGVSNGIDLVFNPAPTPTITSVSPPSAPAGNTILIAGTGFLNGAVVEVDGLPVTPSSVTATAIAFPYPANTNCGATLTVRNPDDKTVSDTLNPQIAITSTALSSGTAAGGATFVIIGQGFAPGTTVTIDGAPATITNVTATAVILSTPAGTPGMQQVIVTSPGGCTATTTYTYL